MKMTCAACGTEVLLKEKAGFRETCPSCDAYLHSCVNCAFWVKSQCTEPSAERVRDPEGMNFCEWFKASAEGGVRRVAEDQGRNAAEEMWKKLTTKKEE
jgi:hypothetical protein